jgi:hypothetical protein
MEWPKWRALTEGGLLRFIMLVTGLIAAMASARAESWTTAESWICSYVIQGANETSLTAFNCHRRTCF